MPCDGQAPQDVEADRIAPSGGCFAVRRALASASPSARALLAGKAELNGVLRKLVGPRYPRIGSVGDGCSLRVVDGGEDSVPLGGGLDGDVCTGF